ncbi:MAG: hypothetical protein ACI9JN_001918 [Bacteroidia bacterium]|jgi:hypothetical protein
MICSTQHSVISQSLLLDTNRFSVLINFGIHAFSSKSFNELDIWHSIKT